MTLLHQAAQKAVETLKPCPFCGGDAELDARQAYRAIGTGRGGTRIAVYCRDCGADIGCCREDVPDIEPEQVIEMWNRRVAPDDLPALVRQLVHALRKAAPEHMLAERALDYLRRHGLQRSPFRTAALQHQEEPREPVADYEQMRLTLIGQVHELLDIAERHAWTKDPEEKHRTEGSIAHARKVTAPYNYNGAASPSTTRQQEVGIANGELSKPMPTLLAQRIVGALECGALWAEGSEAHPRILKTLADFNTWIVRQDAVSALSDEEIAMIARGMPMPPWGIGSRREDAIAFARKVLAAAPSTPEKAGGVSDGVGGNDGVKEAPNAD